MKKAVIVSLCGLLAGLGLQAQAQTMGPVNGNAEVGSQHYYDYGCYQCHGYSGYGRRDLNNTGTPMLINEDVFRAFLRGRAEVAPLLPSTSMPNYPANSLSDEMVSDIYAYIRSMPSNSPETASVRTLQIILESGERPYRP